MSKTTRIATAFTVAMVILVARGAQAVEIEAGPGLGRGLEPNPHGAWAITFTAEEGGPPPFSVLLLLTRDGGVVETDAGPPEPQQFSPGIGEWTRGTDATITIGYAQLQFDPAQNHIGNFTSRMDVTLEENGRKLSGAVRVRFYELNGVLIFEGKGKVEGTRIPIE